MVLAVGIPVILEPNERHTALDLPLCEPGIDKCPPYLLHVFLGSPARGRGEPSCRLARAGTKQADDPYMAAFLLSAGGLWVLADPAAAVLFPGVELIIPGRFAYPTRACLGYFVAKPTPSDIDQPATRQL